MSEPISSELKSFIGSFCQKLKVKNIDLETLNANTSIDLDLNLFDIDLDLFISTFVEHIDHSKFKWKKGQYPKDTFFLALVRTFLNYKKPWVKQLARKIYNPKVFVSDLQVSIRYRTLLIATEKDDDREYLTSTLSE